MLAQLYLDSLMMKTSSEEVQNALAELPIGAYSLESMYSRAVAESVERSSHNQGTMDLAKTILTLMAVSCAPLPLDTLKILSESFESLGIIENNSRIRITKACGSLVHIPEPPQQQTISPIHKSLQDYLVSPKAAAVLGYGNLKEQHRKVSVCCLKYICRVFQDGASKDVCEYPVAYWMDHGRKSSQTTEELNKLLQINSNFFNVSKSRDRWFEMYWKIRYMDQDSPPSEFTMMHMAAESGYTQLARVLLKNEFSRDLNHQTTVEDRHCTGQHYVEILMLQAFCCTRVRRLRLMQKTTYQF